MSAVLFVLEGFPVSVGEALAAAAAACLALTLALAFALLRGTGGDEARLAELSGRLSSLGEWLGAHWLSLGMVLFAFIVVTITMVLDRSFGRLTG